MWKVTLFAGVIVLTWFAGAAVSGHGQPARAEPKKEEPKADPKKVKS